MAHIQFESMAFPLNLCSPNLLSFMSSLANDVSKVEMKIRRKNKTSKVD